MANIMYVIGLQQRVTWCVAILSARNRGQRARNKVERRGRTGRRDLSCELTRMGTQAHQYHTERCVFWDSRLIEVANFSQTHCRAGDREYEGAEGAAGQRKLKC
jgi:hypothetical protein